MFSIIVGVGVIIFYKILQWRYRKFNKLFKMFKYDHLNIPFLGVSYKFFGSDEDRMKAIQNIGREAINKGGNLSGWLAHHFLFVTSDPVISEQVLKNCLEKHYMMQKVIRVLLGNSSLVAPVSIWRPRRKIILPIFSMKNLNKFVTVFEQHSKDMVEVLRPTVGKPIPLFDYLTKYTLESVCETTLGVKLNIQNTPDHPFLSAMRIVMQKLAERTMQPWLHVDAFYKLLPHYKTTINMKNVIFNFTEKIIVEQRKRLAEMQPIDKDSPERIKSFLELLIDSSGSEKEYTNLELSEETMTLVLAGTDTSAVGTGFIFLLLAKYPSVQQKIYDEITEVMGEHDRIIEAADLPLFKYLDAVIKESIRLYPPVPFIIRKVDKDIQLPSGITVPEGTGFVAHLWATNRNPLYWGADAEEFKPERFLDFNPKHPVQFMSFSHGPRNCVGYQYAMMSIKTAVATMLRHYRILPSPETTEPFRLTYEIMMKHVENFNVILEMRRKIND